MQVIQQIKAVSLHLRLFLFLFLFLFLVGVNATRPAIAPLRVNRSVVLFWSYRLPPGQQLEFLPLSSALLSLCGVCSDCLWTRAHNLTSSSASTPACGVILMWLRTLDLTASKNNSSASGQGAVEEYGDAGSGTGADQSDHNWNTMCLNKSQFGRLTVSICICPLSTCCPGLNGGACPAFSANRERVKRNPSGGLPMPAPAKPALHRRTSVFSEALVHGYVCHLLWFN